MDGSQTEERRELRDLLLRRHDLELARESAEATRERYAAQLREVVGLLQAVPDPTPSDIRMPSRLMVEEVLRRFSGHSAELERIEARIAAIDDRARDPG